MSPTRDNLRAIDSSDAPPSSGVPIGARPSVPVVEVPKPAAPHRAVPDPGVSQADENVVPVRPVPPRPKPGTSVSGFVGRIDGASIADLVQMECMRQARRTVRVSSPQGVGFLFFDRGELVHARSRDTSGRAAALEILSWDEGTFDSSPEKWTGQPSIAMSWQGLLMEAARQADERGRREESMISEIDPAEVIEMEASDEERLAPGVTRAVRLDREGQLIGTTGAVGDFADVAAYSVRLCQLIGETLGLEDFVGFECENGETTVIAYVEDETIVALEAVAQSDLGAYRSRAGTGGGPASGRGR